MSSAVSCTKVAPRHLKLSVLASLRLENEGGPCTLDLAIYAVKV